MVEAIVVGVIILAAVVAARIHLRKGGWTKSCVGCAGHCSGSCHCSSSVNRQRSTPSNSVTSEGVG